MSQTLPQHYDYAADGFAIDAVQEERMAFIRRTYTHVFGAILAFMALEYLFLSVTPIRNTLLTLIGGNWWIALIAFMAVSWLARSWAQSGASATTQYLGLGLYVLAEALIICPLLVIATHVGGSELVPTAAFLTMLIFGGLTAFVLVTKADFSFLRSALFIGGLAAMGLVLASAFIGGFNLGMMFAAFMVVLMCGYILYDTSNILHHYRTDQHVSAALALFASIATLFWYVVRLLMIFGSDD